MKHLWIIVALAAVLPLFGEDVPPNRVQITEFDNVLPQIADGNGWSTRFMLVNMENRAGQFTLHFFKEDGTPWAIELKDVGVVTTVTRAVPIGGSVFLETTGSAPTTSQGWAYLDANPYWISGMAIFKADWIDPQSQKPMFAEAVVPLTSEVDVDFFLPFDNRNGYGTSMALVNPYVTGTASVQVRIRNPDGTMIKEETFQLAPGQHIAFETFNRWTETRDRNGVIEFFVPGGEVGVSGLGLLFSPRGTFTSAHVLSIDAHYFQ